MIFDRALKNMANNAERRELLLTNPDDWRIGGDSTIGASRAMKLSAVYRSVQVITDSMSKLPVFVMNGTTKEHIKNHAILPLLTRRPNEVMAPSVYKKLMHGNRLLHGNGYAAIMRNPRTQRPSELLPLPPNSVQPYFDESGDLWYGYTDPTTHERRRIHQSSMIHYKGYSTDGIMGMSVLSYAAQVISTGLEAQGYENAYYKNNAQPPGILKAEGTIEKEAKDKLREEWAKVHSGVDNAFKIAVLDLGLDYKPISINNRDSQFVQSKAVNIEDIARFFGVPLYKLMTGKQAYNSNEQNGIDYVVSTIHPSVTQCEEEDTYKMLFDGEIRKGLEVRYNMMAELRGDSASRSAWYKTGREIGYFSVDDICDLEDTPHVPGGDTRQASLNYVPLDMFRELSLKRNGGGSD